MSLTEETAKTLINKLDELITIVSPKKIKKGKSKKSEMALRIKKQLSTHGL